MTRKIVPIVAALLVLLSMVTPALANPPYPEPPKRPATGLPPDSSVPPPNANKIFDEPNPIDYARNMERQRLLEAGRKAEADALRLKGSDRVLVILVEFAGTDVFTWTAGVSAWDPLGKADTNEYTETPPSGVCADCANIITQTHRFTYTGPLHNQIPRPLSASDRSGDSIWTEDFSPQWSYDFMFGKGVVFDYARVDGSPVYLDFSGESVRDYYQDMSAGAYDVDGDVIGWLQLPHSTWWYGADPCPGARSLPPDFSVASSGGIPAAGNSRTLVKDTLDALNAISSTIPGFSWRNYDRNGDGVIDRLWIVHAGYGEEESTTLLNRTDYGEASMWSHSSSVSPYYPVGEGMSAGPYIMMPENGGIGVFAHEYGHSLGIQDWYAYGLGETSAGFWTLMADDWTGYPIAFLPPALDPYALNLLGWLDPKVIVDPNQVYQVTLGQVSNFPGGEGVYRGAQIMLPTGSAPLPVPVWQGSYYWWGGKQNEANAQMITKNPIALPAGATAATLTFDLTFDLEPDWDFLWVQVSLDGSNWPYTDTLTNTNMICTHDPEWIGGLYGFPDDLCAAGVYGFSGYNPVYPISNSQVLDLSPYIGRSIYLRFWYMTDWATLGAGPFLDSVVVKTDLGTLLSDNAESGDANWNYVAPWTRSDGYLSFTQNYYLQWRNVSSSGGYDRALGDPRWRYGPANTGLLVWYNNNFYGDNEIYNYLEDFPSFGPKGRNLVADAHPEPYRDPYWLGVGYPNSISNVDSRGLMRDAPFSRNRSVAFVMSLAYATTAFLGRPAESMFTDAQGYYPGIEFARRGALPCSLFQWYDQQWDASVVIPAKDFYSTRATGGTYTGAGLRMRGSVNPASLLCKASWWGFWSPPYWDATNTGNPGDSGVDYGWRVQLTKQTLVTGTMKIWNVHYYGALSPDKTVANPNDTVKYTYTIPGNQGGPLSLYACVPLDTSKVQYVAGSATGGAVPLTGSCDAPATVLNPTKATVTAIGWVGYVEHNASAAFSFDVKIKAGVGLMDQDAKLFNDGAFWASLPAQPVEVIAVSQIYLPLVLRGAIAETRLGR